MNRNQFSEKLNSHAEVIVSPPDQFDPAPDSASQVNAFKLVVASLTQRDGAKEASGTDAGRVQSPSRYRH